MKPRFLINEVGDKFARENFKIIQKRFSEEPFLNANFKHFTVVFTGAATNFRFKHDLGFLPKDIILTGKTQSASATVTFNYDLVTSEFIDITVSAAVTIRFLAGTWLEVS